MTDITKEQWMADEVFLLKDGGEMPEVAFHSALFFLSKDPEGPQLILEEGDFLALKGGVLDRYRMIILRDLNPQNRFTSIYRGLERSCANWHRLLCYGQREGLDVEAIRQEVAQALEDFLRQEYDDVVRNNQLSSINCSRERVCEYARELGVDLAQQFPAWQELFADQETCS